MFISQPHQSIIYMYVQCLLSIPVQSYVTYFHFTPCLFIATDCHLGYLEKDPIRGQDSFVTFEEILKEAVKHDVCRHSFLVDETLEKGEQIKHLKKIIQFVFDQTALKQKQRW